MTPDAGVTGPKVNMEVTHSARSTFRRLAVLIGFLALAHGHAAPTQQSAFTDQALLTLGVDRLHHTGAGTAVAIPASPNGDTPALLSVITESKTDTAVVESNPIPIEPGRRYRIQAILNPVKASTETGICVWAREHEELGKRPLLPYPRTGVSARPVKPHEIGHWAVRSLTFTAKPNAHFLTARVSAAGAPAEIHLKSIRILDLERATQSPSPELAKLLRQMKKEARKHEPVLPRPLVFSRSQMKYGLDRNYMRRWIDRPLLVDRATRVPRTYVTPYASYRRIIDVVRQYGLDGLAFFPETKGRMGMFELTERAAPKGFSLLPEFIPTRDLAPKEELLRQALACPQAARINGKVLISSYVAGALPPAEWQTILGNLRRDVSRDFLFLPALTAGVRFKSDFQQGIPIAKEEIDTCKAYLRSYLDVCDGIYFNYAAALKREDRTFDEAFYRELFIPLYKSVLAEPAYHGKLLGLSAYHSHYNADLSLGLQEDGTKTLRNSLSAALDGSPDVVILPEWDEVNENTCIRPTAYNSFTSQRILRYHMNRIKGIPQCPQEADNASIPNLVISYRKVLTIGEKLAIELLNVPDGSAASGYRVAVSLADHLGNEAHRFDSVNLDPTKLEDRTLVVPTEKLAGYPAVIPTVTIEGYRDTPAMAFPRGLHHIQLRATWNWDYKYVKQPLRDLLHVQRASFTFAAAPGKDGVAQVQGSVVAPEPIALVEVLEDDDVVYAVDPKDEFGREGPEKMRVWVELRSLRSQQLKGTITIEGAPCEWRFSNVPLHQPAATAAVQDSKIELETPAFCHVRWIYAIVPRADAADARLVAQLGQNKIDVPLKRLLEHTIYSRTFLDGLTLTACDYWKQPDMPFHLARNTVSFSAPVKPEIATAQLHMRVTAISGRTFRSGPLLLPPPADDAAVDLPIYSDTTQQAVGVSIPASRVPGCVYDFTETYGDILHTDAGRPFWASLGGYIDTTSGRGGNGGGASATLFRFGTQDYPKDSRQTAPGWRTSDGVTCLEFDGIGNYILFPRETLPRRGPFTLTFEIHPKNTIKPQLLFAHRTKRVASLLLYLRDGKLGGAYYGERHATQTLNSDLQVPPGEWSRITVSYDHQTMRLAVDEQQATFPCSGPGLNIGPCVFGGFGTGGEWPDAPGNQWWFGGLLRSFRVRHAPAMD
ncbi:MAG: hypothetical protein HN742_38870 [Lentisphaerae bacterium]|jgi:hypothetical protein|nr:hypothetical protein [Lentisphaerota bacterium]MBT7055918.1 hypothetical protein [Lentisphaerota bacterium]MBT7847894.1 hypothetical protein [Lentisphaerota bacterium]